MGDIYGAIQFAIQVLTPLVANGVSLHFGLNDDVKAIINELQSISEFLISTEERAEGDDGTKQWVKRVRELAFDIEDAIERYQLYLKRNAVSKAIKYILWDVKKMADNIKLLRDTAIMISSAKDRYRLTNNNNVINQGRQCSTTGQGIMITSMFQSTANPGYEIVQDDIAKGEIINLINIQNGRKSPSTTVAVVGMRGLGKTTVVNSIFLGNDIQSNFQCRAWINLSDVKKQDDIIRSMIIQFSEGYKVCNSNVVNNMDGRSLLKLLDKYTQKKRYMVVFDNVREEHVKLTNTIKGMLHSNIKGSKILITTRYENVAHIWLDGSNNGMYKLKPLTCEKAWELFCKKAFKSCGQSCPSHLLDLAQGIVKKCGGLPPVIIYVGLLLSSKANDREEWDKVLNSFGFFIDTNHQLSAIHRTLMMSYYDLSYYLKPCFLYFGMFPEGSSIGRMRLIRLWIAEGFIRQDTGNLTLEDVAEEYIKELINKSMIEVKCKDSCGKVRTVGVVSKFWNEMILSRLEEMSFCKILFEERSVGSETSRRLSIYKNLNNAAEFLENIAKQKSSTIRSLLVEDVNREVMSNVLNSALLQSVNLLKILDLFNAPIDNIPKQIGLLLNLHYLSLRNTRVSRLPKTIGKLENLQTLDLKQTSIYQLPKKVIQLRKLRHILVYNYQYDISFDVHCMKVNGMKIPEGFLQGNCSGLQRLAFIDVNVGHKTWVTEVKSLTQLRKLGILINFNQGQDLCFAIDGKKYLQALNIFCSSKSESIDLTNVESPPLMLKRLYLNGPLTSLPTWVNKLQDLIKIRLRWSNLNTDVLLTLQSLPNLIELHLLEAFTGEQLTIESHGFQKLKVLHLLELRQLKSLCIAKGAMRIIDEMSIGESEHLLVPSGIKHLSTLTKLNLYNMSSSFIDDLTSRRRFYHSSVVKHVSSVLSHKKHSDGSWQTDTLH